MIISIIACVQLPNYGVGFKNQLLFSLKEDMKRFRELTTGHPIIMGRSTWDSLPKKFKPLPDRTNFVLTKNNGERILEEGGIPVKNIDEAIFKSSISEGSEHIFIIGGSRVWEEASKHVSSIYLTECVGKKSADTFFPTHILENFQWKKRERCYDEKTSQQYFFVLFERKK